MAPVCGVLIYVQAPIECEFAICVCKQAVVAEGLAFDAANQVSCGSVGLDHALSMSPGGGVYIPPLALNSLMALIAMNRSHGS